MPISIVVGGQFGSEGKGKIACYLAEKMNAVAAIRVGGSNSGHSVIGPDNELIILQHLPTAAVLDDVLCILSAGSYINPNILEQEIIRVGLDEHRLIIDPNAMVISESDIEQERGGGLIEAIGSTGSGTGSSVMRRLLRDRNTILAKDHPFLSKFVTPTTPILRQLLDQGGRIILEGTQGYGLSLLHSTSYPFTTSRDTTAAGFLSEIGSSPLDVDDIILVMRAFPIRVGGNSGPLPDEIDWDYVTRDSGSDYPIIEHTSVTKNVRRVAQFDPRVVKSAIVVNKPTRLALNHVDYIDSECAEILSITKRAFVGIAKIETQIGRKLNLLGYGPSSSDVLELESDFQWESRRGEIYYSTVM